MCSVVILYYTTIVELDHTNNVFTITILMYLNIISIIIIALIQFLVSPKKINTSYC